MIISKLVINMSEAVRQSYAPDSDGTALYSAHKALWKLFSDGPDRKRDFLYREMEPGAFIAVSARPPQPAGKLWTVLTKPYNPQLQEGERLHFSLRVNPVRKTRDANDRQVRHDIVQHARKRWLAEHGDCKRDIPSRTVFAQEAGWAWFAARAEAMGLAVDDEDRNLFAVERYLPCGFTKGEPHIVTGGKRRKDTVSISLLDMSGFATVTDPQALQRTLFTGVGCAKGFGCGLMLVRRAR